MNLGILDCVVNCVVNCWTSSLSPSALPPYLPPPFRALSCAPLYSCRAFADVPTLKLLHKQLRTTPLLRQCPIFSVEPLEVPYGSKKGSDSSSEVVRDALRGWGAQRLGGAPPPRRSNLEKAATTLNLRISGARATRNPLISLKIKGRCFRSWSYGRSDLQTAWSALPASAE